MLLHSRDIFESFECAMDPVTELPLRKGGRTSSDGQPQLGVSTVRPSASLSN